MVVGSCHLDLSLSLPRLPQPGETLLASGVHRGLGGKGANQAAAAARMGGTVRLIAPWGAGGDQLRAALEAEGVTPCGPVSEDQPCGSAVILRSGAQSTILVVPGADASLRPEDLDPAWLAGCRVPLVQLEIPERAALRAAQLAKAAGAAVILNAAPATELHPALWDGCLDVLVVNRTEAAQLAGLAPTARPEQLLAALRGLAPSLVITLGPEGLIWTEGEGPRYLGGIAVQAVDSTAAGDAFCGVLAERLAAGYPAAQALPWANAAGALAATRLGAVEALPDLAALRARMEAG